MVSLLGARHFSLLVRVEQGRVIVLFGTYNKVEDPLRRLWHIYHFLFGGKFFFAWNPLIWKNPVKIIEYFFLFDGNNR